ncbi:MAG: DUF3141 domain-containing protein [Paenirhodobacter sp.]|uniref:DUF3141 domain-containing protein n=1 Tax=Paenirhodobacter sp. TaxID=1965326 RepID=UPI003D142B17
MTETALPLVQQAWDYTVDAAQRAILYADVRRARGDQYRAHIEQAAPHVLDFPFEVVMDGAQLPRPVNYRLMRILPAEVPTDPDKRPFVIVDPRAGNGPGIGGFKAESEIGVALAFGHPCYFIGFLPDPVAGQTTEDVIRAEAAFLEKVIALHPCCEKPAVIGNCQAGWQILMTAAIWPDLFGPIIVAGTPLSYWAGWKGKNPTRYAGGLLGGSWMTALAGDLGGGQFDGATLVQNFENLDPANTLWKKGYALWSKIDTEAPRYLGFEKYWGGHVFLNDVEMQYMVDNLFVGNRLSSGEIITSDGIRVDLRNIRSPIVVFCSKGDNITPPPQALGWITDMYADDAQILSHGQTIVYAMHESIGHLGIFVSATVGRKEHHKFASNIELINLLPPGIYQAVIRDKTADAPGDQLAEGDYVMAIERRRIDDIREIVADDPDSNRRFAAVARLSQVNLGLYRDFVQHWVRASVTPQSVELMRALHPLRVSYEHWSSRNALAGLVRQAAEEVRAHRAPVDPDNPFLRAQDAVSDAIVRTLDTWRDLRDAWYERTFEWMYDAPFVSALAGLDGHPGAPVRPEAGTTPEHRDLVAREIAALRAEIGAGGLLEAVIRAFTWISMSRQQIDERQFNLAFELEPVLRSLPVEGFRTIVRRQMGIMMLDAEAGIAAIPRMLSSVPPERIEDAIALICSLEELGQAEAGSQEHLRLEQMVALLRSCRPGPEHPASLRAPETPA